MKTHDDVLLQASRRLVVNGGFLTDSFDPDKMIPLLAHQLMDRQTGIYKGETEARPAVSNVDLAGFMNGGDRVRFDLKPNGSVGYDQLVVVDMNHPEFFKFRQSIYDTLGIKIKTPTIANAINLFDPMIAKAFAKFIGVDLRTTLFVIRPFSHFVKPHHIHPFLHRAADRLERNMGTELGSDLEDGTPVREAVQTAWMFDPGQIEGIKLHDLRQDQNVRDFSLLD